MNCDYFYLHGAKDLSSSGGSGESHIETGTKGSGPIVDILRTEVDAVHVFVTLVGAVQVEILDHTTSQDQAGAVGGSVVGQTRRQRSQEPRLGVKHPQTEQTLGSNSSFVCFLNALAVPTPASQRSFFNMCFPRIH